MQIKIKHATLTQSNPVDMGNEFEQLGTEKRFSFFFAFYTSCHLRDIKVKDMLEHVSCGNAERRFASSFCFSFASTRGVK